MTPIKSKLFAATAASLLALSPLAATAETAAVEANSQIETDLIDGMQAVGVNVESYEYLSVAEVSQIKGILESDKTASRQSFEIEQIVDTAATREGFEIVTDIEDGPSSLRAIVAADLQALGLEIDAEALTDAQLAEMKAILASDLSTEDMKTQIKAIVS